MISGHTTLWHNNAQLHTACPTSGLLKSMAGKCCVSHDVHVTMHRDKFHIIKPTRCTNFSILFWYETLHVSDSFSVHNQEYFTVHTAMVYILLICCPQTGMMYTIAVCTVKYSWWWREEMTKTCRVSFQNKIEKLVRLVGFIIRNAVSCSYLPEHQCRVDFSVWLYYYFGLNMCKISIKITLRVLIHILRCNTVPC